MLTSDDKIWIRSLIELAVEIVVDAIPGGDGVVAAQRFRGEYRRRVLFPEHE